MKNYNAEWFIEQNPMTKHFNAVQISIMKKMLREYSEFRNQIQREHCALSAYAQGANEHTVKAIRTALIPSSTVYSLRQQAAEMRENYRKEFTIVREFQCTGKYLDRIIEDKQLSKKVEDHKVYTIRIFENGTVCAFNKDKPSEFYNSLFVGNTLNLFSIKKSLIHLKKLEESNPIAINLTLKKHA